MMIKTQQHKTQSAKKTNVTKLYENSLQFTTAELKNIRLLPVSVYLAWFPGCSNFPQNKPLRFCSLFTGKITLPVYPQWQHWLVKFQCTYIRKRQQYWLVNW